MRPVTSSLAGASSFLSVYLIVAILTTPSFGLLVTLQVVLAINGVVILPLAALFGVNIYLISYNRSRCDLKPGANMSVGVSGSALSAFASFFSLLPLGCCGLLLYFLSWLPAFIGLGATGALIQYNPELVAFGFGVMGISMGISLRRTLKSRASSC